MGAFRFSHFYSVYMRGVRGSSGLQAGVVVYGGETFKSKPALQFVLIFHAQL